MKSNTTQTAEKMVICCLVGISPWLHFKDPLRIFLIPFKRKYFSMPDLTLQVKKFFFSYREQLPKLSFRHLTEHDKRLG